jgi:polyhydroxyalkanoate synthase subunit PhaC
LSEQPANSEVTETRQARRRQAEAGGRTRAGGRPADGRGRSAPAGGRSTAGARRRSGPAAGEAGAPGQRPGDGRDSVAEEASDAILGANPFVGVDAAGIVDAAGRWLGKLSGRPARVATRLANGAAELGRIGLGRSDVAPPRGDRRFTDPAWAEHPAYHRLMQSYLLLTSTLQGLVDDADLDWRSEQRTRYALTLLTDAVAPTNSLLGNPAALKRAFDTAGASLLRGVAHLADDWRRNGGMPSMVDERPFEVGRNVAVSPGAVVYRDEVLELIQYAPSTETVYRRPLVLIPPQINKYYVLDLAPGRSFIEYAVAQGVPFFAISWRNPTAEHRDWDLDTYVGSCLAAVEAATEITGADGCGVLGACAGGITMGLLLGHLAARGSSLVTSATFAVTIMDMEAPSLVGMLASPATVATARRRSRRRGYLDGREMARVFAWLRPNDLVWNYWVNNYLMGDDPPAFDILFWNADTTRLPAALHAGFLDLFREGANPLAVPGGVTVLDTPVDLRQVTAPAYVLAGVTDHIVPWQAAYGATGVLGGPTEFVLSSSGHIQSLVNPPGNPKAAYHAGGPKTADAREWLRGATEARGSWWEHWAAWIGEQSGERVAAPAGLGSERHPPLEPAPGRYVHER